MSGKKGRSYFRNTELVHDGFKISITRSGTVYCRTDRGMVKLDSIWLGRISRLSVSLPNGEEIKIKPGKNGPEIEKEPDNEKN